MTSKIKDSIKAFFQTGLKPTQSQFTDFIDSYVDKSGPIGLLETACSGLQTGAVITSAGSPSIVTYAALKSLMGLTVATTADVVAALPYATTAQAQSGTATGVVLDAVLTKNAVIANAFTSANYATTSQATTGTDNTTIMTPVLTKNAINSLATGITLGTPQATTSGTAINFTGIPATAKKITVNFVGVSTNGTSDLLIQIGPSGGIVTTGYTAGASNLGATTAYTTGFGCRLTVAAQATYGTITLTLENSANNTWVASGTLYLTATQNMTVAGAISLSGPINLLTLTTLGGTNTFDAGEVNITYE